MTVLRIEDILEPENPVRLFPEDETIRDLAASIREVGLLQPILVRRENDKYRIVCGHRRFLACKVAGKTEVEAIIIDGDANRDLEKMLAENVARKDMSPVEEAAFFKEAMDKLGHTPASLAETIGRTKGYVVRRLRILDYPPDIQKALHEGQLGIGVAEVLAQITDEEIRKRYTKDAIVNQISVRTAQTWYDMWEYNKKMEEEGIGDPRVFANERQVEVPKIKCQLCGLEYIYNEVASYILCRRCAKLIDLFWEEYRRTESQREEE